MIDNNPMLNKLENLLTWTSKRQQAIGANLANLDTPGYRAKDYSFDSELQEARKYDVNTTVKADGNNVDLESEMVRLAETSLRYETLSQYVGGYFSGLKSVINAK